MGVHCSVSVSVSTFTVLLQYVSLLRPYGSGRDSIPVHLGPPPTQCHDQVSRGKQWNIDSRGNKQSPGLALLSSSSSSCSSGCCSTCRTLGMVGDTREIPQVQYCRG